MLRWSRSVAIWGQNNLLKQSDCFKTGLITFVSQHCPLLMIRLWSASHCHWRAKFSFQRAAQIQSHAWSSVSKTVGASSGAEVLCTQFAQKSFLRHSHGALVAAAAAAAFAGCTVVAPSAAEDVDIDEFYQIPAPWVVSDAGGYELWEQYGVNIERPHVRAERRSGLHMRRALCPLPSCLRPAGPEDAARLRNMRGAPVDADQNPGIRTETNFITESEEQSLAAEVRALIGSYGSIMRSGREYAAGPSDVGKDSLVQLVLTADGRIIPDPQGTHGPMWRITGRSEGGHRQQLSPWGYGRSLDSSKLPPGLASIAARIAALQGYTLGPLRDVTVNLRTSSVCRLDPHLDPLSDGASGFILTLLSGAVLTFSPVEAVRADPARACNPARFGMQSFSDEDVDCLVRRRSLCAFANDARYLWTHAMRPGLAVELQQEGGGPPRARICDWWGTRAQIMERKEERISIVFAFADPFNAETQ